MDGGLGFDWPLRGFFSILGGAELGSRPAETWAGVRVG